VRLHIAGAVVPDVPHVRLLVSDDGPGIPAAVRERIFEPFLTAPGLGSGTGLRLATVFGIVQQHNGHIACRSEPGQGAAFHIYWRAVPGDALSAPEGRAPLSAGPATVSPQCTVLVVEDEEDVRVLLVRALEQAHYRVYSAATVSQALAVAAAGPPFDLLVTDVMMPGENGPALARQLRQQQPGVRVLFLSGHLADPLDLAQVPGARFLAKPFGLNDLLDAVGSLLAGPAAPPD
jgi:two-component system cell cycle sensor histidine kinase/response regulator CckA